MNFKLLVLKEAKHPERGKKSVRLYVFDFSLQALKTGSLQIENVEHVGKFGMVSTYIHV